MYEPKKTVPLFFKTDINPVPVLHSERAWVLVVSCGRCSVLWSIHVGLSHCFWLCWVFLNVSCLPMWGLCAVFVALQTKKETVREQGWEVEWRGSRDRGLPFTHTAETLPLSKIQHSSYLRKGAVDLIDNKGQTHLCCTHAGQIHTATNHELEHYRNNMIRATSMYHRVLFHHIAYHWNRLTERIFTLRWCFDSDNSSLRFGQAVQRAAGLADGATEAAQRTQAGWGRVWQPETGAAGTAPEWGQSHQHIAECGKLCSQLYFLLSLFSLDFVSLWGISFSADLWTVL